MLKKIKIAQNYETYNADGRMPLEKLYKAYLSLPEKNWDKKIIYTETIKLNNGRKVEAPILSFFTKKKGPALWLIAGIHGEEPAGPNALAKSTVIRNYRIPMVFLPLCNPKGYRQNWRYLDKRRGKIGKSVGDAEHLLLDAANKPRGKLPNSPQADALTKEALNLSKTHPPLITINFHEDELVKGEHYIYSQGKDGFADPIVEEIVRVFQENGLRFMKNGIIHGIHDSSIDELFSAEKIFLNGKIIKKPAAKSVIVIETPVKDAPIEERIKTNELVIKSLKNFWKIRSCNR